MKAMSAAGTYKVMGPRPKSYAQERHVVQLNGRSEAEEHNQRPAKENASPEVLDLQRDKVPGQPNNTSTKPHIMAKKAHTPSSPGSYSVSSHTHTPTHSYLPAPTSHSQSGAPKANLAE